MIRVAAAGDVHYDRNSQGKLLSHLEALKDRSDILLLAGDLTQTGNIEEGRVLAHDLAKSPVPVIAVLGNHDYQGNQWTALARILGDVGVTVLDGTTSTQWVNGCSVGIAGHKGFGGGFVGACGSDFGEPEMKEFIQHTKFCADALRNALASLETDYRIALVHYSPVEDTLLGEKREIYPFLGSYFLAQAIDEAGADIVFHGHAHKGSEKGATPGGIPVRNVAQSVIRHTFNIYMVGQEISQENEFPWGERIHEIE